MSFQTLYCVGAMWEGKATPTFRPIRLRVESVGGDELTDSQGELIYDHGVLADRDHRRRWDLHEHGHRLGQAAARREC